MIMLLLRLFMLFFKIGAFSFGGGYVMLPIIYQGIQEIGKMTAEEFANLVALSQITPGPIAINAATYVGYEHAGVIGAVTATIGVALPSIILVILVMKMLDKFKGSQGVEAVLGGVRPATVGLLATAVIFLAETSIYDKELLMQLDLNGFHLIPLAICILTVYLHARFKISPIKLTLLAALLGVLFTCLQ